ncbi:hypothetical protein TNCV_124051 [Trichonephila clavipes]|nr:hypothetical protein TNCV_124051 [Trichonephila clavipes]
MECRSLRASGYHICSGWKSREKEGLKSIQFLPLCQVRGGELLQNGQDLISSLEVLLNEEAHWLAKVGVGVPVTESLDLGVIECKLSRHHTGVDPT